MEVLGLTEVEGAGGYTPALRQSGRLVDGTPVFVKTPTNDVTRKMLAAEVAAYETIGPQPFCPLVIDASPERLVLEDLRHAHWPPPWRPGDVDRVLATVRSVASVRVPSLPTFEASQDGNVRQWAYVDVDAVAALGFDRGLVEALVDAGREVDASASYDGDALLHMDLRSDNLCITRDGRVVLVDWNGACRGQAGMDEACWASSLTLEGGPDPWELLPDAAVHHVAFVAGYFAQRSPLPVIPDAPLVRSFQRAQLRIALPWFARLVG